MRILVDARLEPDYWDSVVARHIRSGNKEEARLIIEQVREACGEAIEMADELEELMEE